VVLRSTTTSESREAQRDRVAATADRPEPTASSWLDKGLILSSFSDGLASNPRALDWWMSALVGALWREEQGLTQAALEGSNLASPCNGPDPELLGRLEAADRVVEESKQPSPERRPLGEDWKDRLGKLCRTKKRDGSGSALELRVAYVPTAMYALRPGSTSSPGKQRQRNRADGQKRRNALLSALSGQLLEFFESGFASDDEDPRMVTVRTVTLDLDDASVKRPEERRFGGGDDAPETASDHRWAPESGKEAIRDWNPHLIYVQGGNTFWLHHCLEKGDWAKDIIDACCCSDSGEENSSSPPSFPAVYVGVSAGAILAGESMQTACWKAWDDPSVVPGKETYGDWTDSRGLGTAGRTSFFPHMTEEWRDLTERKTKELLRDGAAADTGRSDASVFCLRDDQAFAVDGRTQSIVEL